MSGLIAHQFESRECVVIDPLHELSPSEQIALLTLARSDFTDRIRAWLLRNSTARANRRSYLALIDQGLAKTIDGGWQRLTPAGEVAAHKLARQLRKEFNIAMPAPRRKVFSAAGSF